MDRKNTARRGSYIKNTALAASVSIVLGLLSASGAGAAATTTVGAEAAPPTSVRPDTHNTTVCGTYVCEIVQNQAQGSDYVISVTVYDKNGNTPPETYAYGVNSQIRGSQPNATGRQTFPVMYNVNSGNCVYGQISNYGNSGCWTAP